MSLQWKGNALEKKVAKASARAIDETMALAVVEAKATVPRKTTLLQGSIKWRAAIIRLNRVIGQWGSFDVNYAIYVEKGTGRMAAQPYLFPAADREYPKLAARIRKNLKAL